MSGRPPVNPGWKTGGVTQGEIARGTGLSVSHVCKVLGGKRGMSMRTAEKIAGYLGMSIEQLNRAVSARVKG